MSWEKSKAATPLKRDFLKAFFAREKRFFLTGGSALGLFYLDHRRSYDLDLFSTEQPGWIDIDGVVRASARESGCEIGIMREGPTFRRYKIERAEEVEIVDVVLDLAPQRDVEKNWMDGIQVDTLREIMVNKIATLISRSELKDVVDLYFLEKEGMRVEDYFHDARGKNGGLDPAMMSMILDSMNLNALPDYLIKPLTLDELVQFVQDLKKRLILMAFPGKPAE